MDIYLDGDIIKICNIKEYAEHLCKKLKILKTTQLFINLDKYKYDKEEIEFLNHGVWS